MGVRDSITTTRTRDNGTLTMKRTLAGDTGNSLPDFTVPNGAVNLPVNYPINRALLQSFVAYADQALTLRFGGTNAVQTLSMTGPPTAGTFTLTFASQTTGAIPYNATAAQVQAALQALSSVGAGGFLCAGGPLPATPITITGAGPLGLQALGAITSADSLTGGSSAIAATTAGSAPSTTIALKASVPLDWDAQGYYACPLAADFTTVSITNASGVDATLNLRSLSSAS